MNSNHAIPTRRAGKGGQRMFWSKLIFYSSDPDLLGRSVVAQELDELPTKVQGEVKAAMTVLEESDNFTWPAKCRMSGPVRCVKITLERSRIHVFYTPRDSSRRIVILHVTRDDTDDCPVGGYQLARSRRTSLTV